MGSVLVRIERKLDLSPHSRRFTDELLPNYLPDIFDGEVDDRQRTFDNVDLVVAAGDRDAQIGPP